MDSRSHRRTLCISIIVAAFVALTSYTGVTGLGADTTAPSTDISYSGSAGSNGWSISSVSVTLHASDGTSGTGVNYTLYNLEGAGWQNYTAQITISGDGIRTLQYYSVDMENNTEATRNITIKIDATNPKIDLEQSSGGVYGSSDVRITWTSSDAMSGLDYFEVYSDGTLFDVLDNATRIEHVTNLIDGWHNVTLRAYDKAGNSADSVLSFRVWANQGNPNESTDLIIIAAAIAASAAVISFFAIRRYRMGEPPENS
jgi:hypothetical protein